MLFRCLKSFWNWNRSTLSDWNRPYSATGKALGILGLCVALFMTGCSIPQVSAESRLFLNLSLSYLGEYNLPQTEFEGTTVGGISALSYDRQRDRIYALADDDRQPRFYTLNLNRDETSPTFAKVTVEAVTRLQDLPQSATADLNLDGEGIELTHRSTVFVASEGNPAAKVPPRLSEFQLATGNWQGDLPLPKQYWSFDEAGTLALSVQPNQGLESLAINTEGDRLYTATETPLFQDLPQAGSVKPSYYSRFLHYWIGEPEPLLISEHHYPLDPPESDTTLYGLSDLVPVDNAGHFLSLERSYSPSKGYRAKIYQMETGNASDTSRTRTLSQSENSAVPIRKKLLLNLSDLGISLQNLEGVILGPYLEDGSRSIVLASDNNFQTDTPTQFLVFRLGQNQQSLS